MRALVVIAHRWGGLAVSLVFVVSGATGVVFLTGGPQLLTKITGRLHESLGLGRAGSMLVGVATAVGLLLELSGLYLWLKRRSISVSFRGGLYRAAFDLHHAVGALGSVFMMVILGSAVAYFFVLPRDQFAETVNTFHHGRAFGTPVKLLYGAASVGFVVQGASGVLMWARRTKRL